jgi:hypothetical protein
VAAEKVSARFAERDNTPLTTLWAELSTLNLMQLELEEHQLRLERRQQQLMGRFEMVLLTAELAGNGKSARNGNSERPDR